MIPSCRISASNTAPPREALAIMIALNNKYALDGRNPNSYSGISWVLGRYDRPWFSPLFDESRGAQTRSARWPR